MEYRERTLGAYTSLEQLASYQLAARQLKPEHGNRALSHLSGPFRTHIRGRGIEFEDVRLYQAGDDIRAMEWRITARSGKPHTKQFREEREKPVVVVADQRHSMFFGSRKALKSVAAADLAAYLAWSAFHQGDRVGGLVLSDNGCVQLRPRHQRRNLLQLLRHLADSNKSLTSHPPAQRLSFTRMLQELRPIARPGTRIYLISDFHDLSDDAAPLLHQLSAHTEMIAIQVYDALEAELPPAGVYHATDGATTLRFDSAKSSARSHYADEFQAQQEHIRTLFARFAIPLVAISTEESPFTALQNHFGKARRRRQAP